MSEANRITNKNETKYHNMTFKTGTKPYFCEPCGIGYSTKSDFEQHFRTHMGENPFKCKICEKTFFRQLALKDHINSHMGLKPHICNVCNDGFSFRRTLLAHVKTHLHVFHPGHYPITILMEKDGRSYECNICKKKFRTEYNVMKHLSSFTGMKAFNCKLCGKGFFTNQKFETHFQTDHKDKCPFKCSDCKMRFPQKEYLEGHIISAHTPGSKPFKCKVCNSRFILHSRLKAHMILHSPERSHVCKRCSARFFRKDHLERHLKIHERQDKTAEFIRNGFNLTPQHQQQRHNLTVNPQETEVNVNAQEISGEALNIQDALETSMTLAADNKDPAYDVDYSLVKRMMKKWMTNKNINEFQLNYENIYQEMMASCAKEACARCNK